MSLPHFLDDGAVESSLLMLFWEVYLWIWTVYISVHTFWYVLNVLSDTNEIRWGVYVDF